MVDYSKPITDGDIKKAKTWYDIVCWGGLLIVLLPVGIANLILGYLMGDSPCTLCWGQREQMAFIGVVALFMVRYGFKPKYLATMLVMAAVGLWSSFRHLGVHAARDVGQGFGLEIMGLHTQMWAEIVFWCVVMLFGLALFLAPRFDALIAELKGKRWRPTTGFMPSALSPSFLLRTLFRRLGRPVFRQTGGREILGAFRGIRSTLFGLRTVGKACSRASISSANEM